MGEALWQLSREKKGTRALTRKAAAARADQGGGGKASFWCSLLSLSSIYLGFSNLWGSLSFALRQKRERSNPSVSETSTPQPRPPPPPNVENTEIFLDLFREQKTKK